MPSPFRATCLLLLTTLSVCAVDCTFTGAIDGSWNKSGNWSPAQVPAAGKTVDIPSGKTATLDVATPALGAVTVEGGLTIAQTLQATTLASSGTVSLATGTIRGATITGGTITCNSAANAFDGVTLASGTILDLTTVWGACCYLQNTVTIHGTVRVGSADTSTYGRLYWSSVATTWNGTGSIVFGGSTSNVLSAQIAGTTLTIGNGLTIHGNNGALTSTYANTGSVLNNGTIISDGGGSINCNLWNWGNAGTLSATAGSTLVLTTGSGGTGANSGTMTTTGGTLTVTGGTWSNTAAAGVGAANGTLNLGGAWSCTGAGTISTSSAAINLGGTFSSTQAQAIQHSGVTTITITGSMNNSASTLALGPTTGSWYMNGGTITGGTITGTQNERLICLSASNTLDGVTLASGAILDLTTVWGALCYLQNTVTINGTVLVGSTDTTTYGRLYWNTVATIWNGTGSIVFGGSTSNVLSAQSPSTTLTIGNALTIHGNNGNLSNNYSSTGSVLNNGTISSDGGGTIALNLWNWSNAGTLSATTTSTLTVTGGGIGTNSGTMTTNGGTLTVTGGTWTNTAAAGVGATNGTLNLGGAWSSTGAGTISTSGSTINLGGSFTSAQAMAIQHTGSTGVYVTGAMNNAAATLAWDPATWTWYMDGGSITGGTISGTLGERLICLSANSTLDGVTLASGATLDLTTVWGALCYLQNTVTINGTVLVGSSDGVNYGRLYWTAVTTLWNGTGAIVFGGSTSNVLSAQVTGSTLTIGNGLTIHGNNGSLTSTYASSGSVLNNGTIISDGGGTINCNLWSWSNAGTLSATAGSTMVVTTGTSGTGTNNGSITTTGGSLTVTGGTWSNTAAAGVAATTGTLTLGGAWSCTGAGTISTSGSSINLGGTFTSAQAMAIQHTGATAVYVTGAMNNAAATLAWDPATWTWYMNAGSITGGTISGTLGERLICLSANSTLDGVTLASGATLDLTTVWGALCNLQNTVTINGTVLVGSSDGVNYGRLYWSTATTLWNGTGAIVFGGSTSNVLSAQVTSSTLTIGNGLTIHGNNGSLTSTYASSGSVFNNGTIISDGGGTINCNLWNWSNAGAMSATAGSTLVVSTGSSGTGTNSGTMTTTGGTLTVTGGTWSNTAAAGVGATTGTLNLGGAWSCTGAGTISTSGSAINLGGAFTTAQAMAIQHTGVTAVSITGAMNNAAATLAWDPATWTWYMNGGTITGGAISGTLGERLICLSANNTLDGVTLASGATLDLTTVWGALCYLQNTVTFDGTVLVGSSDGVNYGRLYWSTVATTWNGTGTIVFGGSTSNVLSAQITGSTLTIGNGLTIHGNNGSLTSTYASSGSVLNNGTIISDGGGTINCNLWSWSNAGTLSATAGSTMVVTTGTSGTGTNNGSITTTGGSLTVTGGTWSNTAAAGVTATTGTLTLGGAWSSTGAGTISTSGSTINLGGSFTSTQAMAIQHTGATAVYVTGAMNNAAATLAWDPATWTWTMNGGSITGGTISGTLGERLICQNAGSALDGVTLAAGATLDLSTVWAACCYLQNTVTINGTVLVGSSDGVNYGRLYWNTVATAWNGTGSIVFGGSTSNVIAAQNNSTTLTIGSTLTIHGINGTLNNNYGGTGTLVNNGAISSDGGGAFAINAMSCTNNGTITVGAGAKETWNCAGSFTQSGSGVLALEIGGTGAGQSDRLAFAGTSTISLGGTVRIVSTGGFVPLLSTSVDIITIAGGTISGSATVPNSYSLTYGATKVTAVGLNGLSALSVALSSAAANPVIAGSVPVTATFSSAVTGLGLAGLTPTNATVANLAGSGTTYTFDLIPSVTQGTISVVVAAGAARNGADLTNTVSSALTRIYNGVDPTITLISPATGTTAGGTPVVITGSGFIAGSTAVTFAGSAATGVSVTGNHIACTTPGGSAGAADVQVAVAGRTVTSSGGFTYATPAAADVVFTGNTNANWNTANNWSPASVPTVGQKVDIPAGKVCILNVGTPVLGAVTVEGSLTLQGGYTFQASTLTNNGVVQLNGTTLKVGTVSGSLLTATNTTNLLDGVALDADLDLTQANGAQVTITNTVTLGDGRTIWVGNAAGTTYGYLNFTATATLTTGGSAAIALGASGNNLIRDVAGNTTMSISSGITISGGAGAIYASGGGSTLGVAGLIDATAAGQAITVGNGTTTLTGTVRASGGILTLAGSWSNSGTIALSAGTVNLGGSFSEGSVQDARWSRSGGTAGTVNLTGTLAIGGTLTHTTAMGRWYLSGCTITGGTIATTGGTLWGTNTTTTLNGVTLDEDLDLTQVNGAQVTITGTMTLGSGRSIAVGNSGGTTNGYLNFSGVSSLTTGGSASVVLGGSVNNLVRDITGGTAISIGSGVTITGGAGSIYASGAGSSLGLAGLVDATTAGQTITVGYNTDPTTITGTVRASGGVLTLVGTWSNSGTIALSAGTVNLGGSFSEGSVQSARWNRSGGTAGTVNVSGTLTIGGTLTHTAAMGAWRLVGGTINGGLLMSTGGTLVGTNTNTTLNGLTLDADLDLTQVNGAQVTITNTVILGQGGGAGRTIAIGASGGATYGYLFFTGGAGNNASLLAGNASAAVVLGSSGNNLMRDSAGNTAITIGSGLTITGGAGGIYAYQGGSTLAIAGLIDATASGQTITVGYNADLTSISGTVRTSGGILSLTGSWTSSGTIAVTAGTVNLGGGFSETSVQDARWNRSGGTAGTVNLTGTLTIGGTLTHTTAMGRWNLAGCTISGGTLTSTGGTLRGTSSTTTLNGLVLDEDLDLTQVNGAQVTITNNVTLGKAGGGARTISVGASGGSTYGYIFFTGGTGNNASLLAGNASAAVVLGASSTNLMRDVAGNTAITIGSGLTISGGSGSIYAYQGGSTLTMSGTIDAATAGQTLIVGYNTIPTTITGTGTVRASTGILTLGGTWSNSGTIAVASGTVNLGGTFTETSVQAARWNRSGGTVNLTGTLTIGGTLTHTAAMGAWRLAGCTVNGGTLTSTGGTLVGTNATNTLNGLTLDADCDLTQVSGAQVTITGTVTLGNLRTIAIGASGGSTYGYIYFSGTATLATSGTAAVVLGGSGSNLMRDAVGSTAITIGSGVTVSGGSGSIYASQSGSTLTIAGTIDAASSGQTIIVGNNADLTAITGTGTVRASTGILTMAGSWANSGTIAVASGTVNLGGAFTEPSVQNARWNRSGGTVNLTGTLNIGGTLTHTTAMGAWRLAGCAINGGTLSSTGGTLVGTNATNTLNGLTLDADCDLTQVSGAQVTITGTVTLGNLRTIAVGNAGGTTYGYVYFSGTASLATSGTATVLFGTSGSNLIRDAAGSTAMTIASGVTVSGGAGSIYASQSGSTLAIAGTVDAATASRTVTIGSNGDATTITGTLKASAGILTLAGTWSNAGTIITQTGTINLGGAFGYASVLGARWNRSGTDTVNLTGVVTIGPGNTLTLDAQTGSWLVQGATLSGGTLSDSGSRLVFSTTGTLDGVTIPVGTVLDLGLTNGATCYLNNSITINGTIKVGRSDGGTYGRLFWSTPATWAGSGDILFGASLSNAWTAQSGAGALTIAAPLLVHGQNTTITATIGGSSIINNGTLAPDVAGGGFPFNATTFTNNGTLIVGRDNAQNWSCTKNFTQSASGILELDIAGTGVGQADRLAFSGTSTIVLGGTVRLVSSGGFMPNAGTSVDLITIGAGSITGSFTTVQGAYSLSYASAKVTALGTAGLTPPTVVLTSAATDPTTASPVPVTATFSTAVTNFTVAGLVPSNATLSGFAGSGTTYTFNLVPTVGQGTVGVSVTAGVARDAQLLTNTSSNILQRFYNGVDPTIAVNGISPIVGSYLGGSPVTITGTGYLAGSTSVRFGGVAATVGTVNATSIACTTPAGTPGTSMDVQVAVAGRSVTVTNGFTYSALPLPGIASLNPASGVMAGGTTVTITGVNLNGTTAITFAGVAATGVNVVGPTTVTCVTPAYSGQTPLAVDVLLTTGVGATTRTAGFYYGNAPTVAVTPDGTATNSAPITFTMAFSAAVTGLGAGGLTVTNGSLGTISGSGTTWTVPVTPTADGAVTLAVNANAAIDINSLGNPASNVASVTYDHTPPTVVITPASGIFTTAPIIFALAFSEPVSGLTPAGLTVGNGSAGTIAVVDASHFTCPITPTGPGAVSVSLAAAAVQDAAGNANAASATATVTFGNHPTVAVASGASPTNANPISFTLTFSAPVTGLGAGGLAVTNGGIGTISGSGSTWTVPVTPGADGAVTLAVNADAAIDANSLGNLASNVASVSYDGTPPTVVITPASGVFTTAPITFALAFSESVSGLTPAGLTVGNGTPGTIAVVDASHFTVPITPTGPGAVSVSLGAATVHDGVGNANAASATATVIFGSHPTVAVASVASPTNANPITFTLTFSAPVTGLGAGGLAVTNGSIGTISGSGTTWSVPVTSGADGAVTLAVNANAAIDANSLGNLASNVASVSYDGTPPTVAITPASGVFTTAPITFALAFSESVSGLTPAGLTVGNGTPGTIAVVDASHFTVPITPTGPGAVSVSLAAAAVQDAAGNANAASATATVTFGNHPTVVVANVASPTNANPITFTLTFSTPVTGLGAGGLAVTNGSIGTISGSGTTWSVPVTPGADGAVTLAVNADAAIDANSLGNLASNVASVSYDGTPPTVAITPASGVFTTAPITFTLAFTEAVSGLTPAGLTVGNGSAGSIAVVDASHYTVPITPAGPGAVSVSLAAAAVHDAAGNANAASATATVVYAVAPTVVVSGGTSPTNANPITFTLTFSAPVTGLGAGGLAVTNGSIGTISGSGTTWSVPVTPGADGAVTLAVNANAAIDANSLGNLASNVASVSYDGTLPTVAITPASGVFTTAPITFTLAFTEAVSGLTPAGLTVGNGTAGTITAVDAGHYTVPITPAGPGAVSVALAAAAVHDAVGNANALSATATVIFAGNPTVVVASGASPTNADPITFTLTFSTSVTGLGAGGLAVTNGGIGTISGGGTTWSVPVTPGADGVVTLAVNANAAIDANQLGNLASNVASVTYDGTPPTVVISPAGGTTTVRPISFRLAFSEPVTGLGAAGLTVGNGTLGTISGSGTTWTVVVAPLALGPVALSLLAGAVVDAVGNPVAATGPAVVDYDPVLTVQHLDDAVGIIGQPLSLPVVADSTALLAHSPQALPADVTISAVTDLAPLGLSLTRTGNGRAWLGGSVPAGLGAGTYPITLSATDGLVTMQAGFTLTVVAATTAPIPAPILPVTEADGPAHYATIGMATSEGILSLRSAMAGKGLDQVRAFAFDGSIQQYAELPAEPVGGLTVYDGVFIVNRLALPIDLSGTPTPMPGVLVLQPGWNLLGVPSLHDGNEVHRSHPWEDFQLQSADGVPIADPGDLIGTPGGPLTSTRPWLWDGSAYVQVPTLTTGVGYWFKNNGTAPLRLVRQATTTTGQPGSVTTATPALASRITAAGLRTRTDVVDQGVPPAPPGGGATTGSGASAIEQPSSSGGCGLGSGFGALGCGSLLLLAAWLRRRTDGRPLR